MRRCKCGVVLLCALIVSLWSAVAPAQAASPVLMINNEVYHDQQTDLIDGRVYVPLRVISEGLGYSVQWHAVPRMITIDSIGDNQPVPSIPSDRIQVRINGKILKTDTERGNPYINNGRTMVPLRSIAEGLGAEVNWNNETRQVSVKDHSAEQIAAALPIEAEAVEVAADPYLPLTTTHERLSATELKEANQLTIMGPSIASREEIEAYLSKKEMQVRSAAEANGKRFVPFPEGIGGLYYDIGQRYNIRGDVALAQALHETGNFQYGNEVVPAQNNYCGLGAIGRKTTEADLNTQIFSKINASRATLIPDTNGWWYASPSCGVEAHIQHLYSYASAQELPAGTELIDGRFNHGNRGKATYWSDLNGKWAVPGVGYGETIVDRHWRGMVEA